ncbi:cytidine deaminase [Nocardioidaceae bacterium]|nr:cytidine deaminase [Nocardioidaceae bacterium]
MTLARSARARTRAAQGAAVRDLDGRTYASATVELPSFSATAAQVAVAMAVASGARGLEAVVVLDDGDGGPGDADVAVTRDLAGDGCPVHAVTATGDLRATVTT